MLIIGSTQTTEMNLRDFFKIQYAAVCGCHKKESIFIDYQLNKQDPICMDCKKKAKIKFYVCPEYLIIIGDNSGDNSQKMLF